MLLKWDLPKLEKLAKNFYEITGTLVSIYDVQQRAICSYPKKMCGFCREVRTNPALAQACRDCDRSAFQTCQQSRRTHIYHCHMGLIEVATPIVCNNVIIGYMLFGQIAPSRDKEALTRFALEKATQYDLDSQIILSEIPKIKYRTPEYISAISELLEMCANHIWLSSIISVHNEGLAHSIDFYIQQNLRRELSIQELCQVFSISRGTLYNISKKNFGCGITEYVTLCRIAAAKRLLEHSDMRISDVAEAVGYCDDNYFIRIFKKHTGQTPKKYRGT